MRTRTVECTWIAWENFHTYYVTYKVYATKKVRSFLVTLPPPYGQKSKLCRTQCIMHQLIRQLHLHGDLKENTRLKLLHPGLMSCTQWHPATQHLIGKVGLADVLSDHARNGATLITKGMRQYKRGNYVTV